MRYKSIEDRIVDVVAVIIVALVAICCLYPIIYCFSTSLSGDDAIVKHSVTLFPVGLNFESYLRLMNIPGFLKQRRAGTIRSMTGISGTTVFRGRPQTT